MVLKGSLSSGGLSEHRQRMSKSTGWFRMGFADPGDVQFVCEQTSVFLTDISSGVESQPAASEKTLSSCFGLVFFPPPFSFLLLLQVKKKKVSALIFPSLKVLEKLLW